MGKTLLRCAVLYALLGIGLGIAMGVQQDFTNKGVHVHINLLGWVSMALIGVIYQVFPALATSVLARVHCWLHNVGLPVMALGIYAIAHDWSMASPLIGVGSLLVALAFAAFALNVWRNVGATEASPASATPPRHAVSRPAGVASLA
jgi:hypothetical protein